MHCTVYSLHLLTLFWKCRLGHKRWIFSAQLSIARIISTNRHINPSWGVYKTCLYVCLCISLTFSLICHFSFYYLCSVSHTYVNISYSYQNCMYKKSWPILYSKLVINIGHDFLDTMIQYKCSGCSDDLISGLCCKSKKYIFIKTRLFGHAVIDIFYIYISAFLCAAKQDMINHIIYIRW